mmetsp:Transcript_3471/g.6463  ORF Transcript_3471/g.6463 Transcript_3471/m.6463 type:complete len:438 (+) Transcript_3471:1-1314(+)
MVIEALLRANMPLQASKVFYTWAQVHPLLHEGACGMRLIGQFSAQRLAFLESAIKRASERLRNPVRLRHVLRELERRTLPYKDILGALRAMENGTLGEERTRTTETTQQPALSQKTTPSPKDAWGDRDMRVEMEEDAKRTTNVDAESAARSTPESESKTQRTESGFAGFDLQSSDLDDKGQLDADGTNDGAGWDNDFDLNFMEEEEKDPESEQPRQTETLSPQTEAKTEGKENGGVNPESGTAEPRKENVDLREIETTNTFSAGEETMPAIFRQVDAGQTTSNDRKETAETEDRTSHENGWGDDLNLDFALDDVDEKDDAIGDDKPVPSSEPTDFVKSNAAENKAGDSGIETKSSSSNIVPSVVVKDEKEQGSIHEELQHDVPEVQMKPPPLDIAEESLTETSLVSPPSNLELDLGEPADGGGWDDQALVDLDLDAI